MGKAKLVGIVNVTPDSFSDGGTSFRPEDAISAIIRLIDEGASVIDIGAESTRPGATPLSPEEEWQRLEPVLELLPRTVGVEYSLDTRHIQTAKKARNIQLAHGAFWLNDVSGFADPAMGQLARDSGSKIVLMHSLSVPADKNIVLPEGTDVVKELLAFANQRIQTLEALGVKREQIIFDPGLGFGKSATQSWEIIENIKKFQALGVPLFVGHSRKSFLSYPHRIMSEAGNPQTRDEQTLVVSGYLAKQGVEYLRVHDVAAHQRVLAYE